ncbi:hypothetical protein DM01DRAFT_1410918 [Hesseltinella vesiculosa]|uniref:Integrin alpha N-terminal domain-containing protein n=1 Tax=Hesseltinella vesiculosa TaxID=101127 RepID=A0A1X2G5Q8_9FUNG|nr:hypothetical protein DM01DRAFT_1410918 [Hesseltinella vesiculosa]
MANVDDDLYQETHYARFGYERTNIYGVASFQSSLPTYMEKPVDFPSSQHEKVTDTDLPLEPKERLSKPRQHLITASASELTVFISNDGHWNCLCLDLGLFAGKSEVISIDAFETEDPDQDDQYLIFGMAVAEKADAESENGSPSFTLRLYGHDTPVKGYLETSIASITESSQIIPLEYAPMQLTHTRIRYKGESRPAFLLALIDGSIQMYVQDQGSRQFERIIDDCPIPLFQKIYDQRAGVSFMHIYDRPDGGRVICTGGQRGELFLAFYDPDGNEKKLYQSRVFSPVTSVQIFQPRAPNTIDEDDLSLVVTSAIERATVYRSICTHGLSNSRVLPQSSQFDSVLCSHVADVDWDGEREILIGTYGRQLIIYKQVAGTQEYNILWRRQFAYPLYRIMHLDLNCDGLDELLVMTMYGVHILQPNLQKAKAKLLDAIQYIEGSKKQKLDMMNEFREQQELEEAIVFEQ